MVYDWYYWIHLIIHYYQFLSEFTRVRSFMLKKNSVTVLKWAKILRYCTSMYIIKIYKFLGDFSLSLFLDEFSKFDTTVASFFFSFTDSPTSFYFKNHLSINTRMTSNFKGKLLSLNMRNLFLESLIEAYQYFILL